jgi:hypothetical protein
VTSKSGAGVLRCAIVLSTTEDECTVVVADDRTAVVAYAQAFPRPRAERVAPGHLVAIMSADDGAQSVVWRWFDAVVVGSASGSVSLWEPGHGIVQATPRDRRHDYRVGSRAYLSAGLPGAHWWVAGPAVDRAAEADVELDEVERFLTGLGA